MSASNTLATRRTSAELLRNLHLDVGHSGDGEVDSLKHACRVLGDGDGLSVNDTLLGNVVKTTLTLLLLQLQRNATYWATLDALHKMRGETSDLVAQTFRRDDSDLLDNLLVRVEVKRQLRVVFLNNLARGSLDQLGTNATLKRIQGWSGCNGSSSGSLRTMLEDVEESNVLLRSQTSQNLVFCVSAS